METKTPETRRIYNQTLLDFLIVTSLSLRLLATSDFIPKSFVKDHFSLEDLTFIVNVYFPGSNFFPSKGNDR